MTDTGVNSACKAIDTTTLPQTHCYSKAGLPLGRLVDSLTELVTEPFQGDNNRIINLRLTSIFVSLLFYYIIT